MDFKNLISSLCQKQIGITGASGVIGSSLVKNILSRHPSTHLNIFQRENNHRSEWNSFADQYQDNLSIFKGELRDLDRLIEFTENSAVVFHLALASRNAFASKEKREENKELLISNTLPCAVLAETAHSASKPFIFSSSYGIFFHINPPGNSTPVKEEDVLLETKVLERIKEYAALTISLSKDFREKKISGDKLLCQTLQYLDANNELLNFSGHELYVIQKLVNEYQLKEYPHAIALRIGNVYGKGDTSSRIVPGLINQISSGGKQIIQNERRSFIHLDDISEGLLRAACIASLKVPEENSVITLAHPVILSTYQVAQVIKDCLGVDTELISSGEPENQFLGLDLSRMKNILDINGEDLITIDKGIRKILVPD